MAKTTKNPDKLVRVFICPKTCQGIVMFYPLTGRRERHKIKTINHRKEQEQAMQYVLSEHARKEHQRERWNPKTILEHYQQGKLKHVQKLHGETADVLYGYTITGTCVGLVLAKPEGDRQIVITGFASSEDYWRGLQ